ncbi:MAG: dTMP kinase, partial [Bdellovibrionales bacterium]|nr:dTMP kinase [Bdellovibrionales bacterium]
RTLRNILLSPETKNLEPTAELMLFAADRAQHVAEVIRPALARGALVICDRFTHSTVAYQGYGRGLPLPMLHDLNRVVTGGLQPDLVVLLDLPPEIALNRVQERSEKSTGTAHADELKQPEEQSLSETLDRFEQQSLAFHRAVRQGFLSMAAEESGRFVTIDATSPLEHVVEQAVSAIRERLV